MGIKKYLMELFEKAKEFKRANNEVKIITAPKGSKYLSDFIKKLPSNTFLDKSITGVGATTMALESKQKFIVAVPYQALANNKAEWCLLKGINVLLVQQGVKEQDIIDFKGDKIIVVFDSLWKLTKSLSNRKSFRLMVDEVHVVLTSAIYRGTGMNVLMNNLKEFKDYILISATPTKELYDLKGFKDAKRVKIEWLEKEDISYFRDLVTKEDDYTVADKLILISMEHLNGKIDSNAYFFVNSVKIIIKVVQALKKLKLVTPNQVNIIVANGNNNNAKIKVQIGQKYSIGKPPAELDTPLKLNFITSTAFEGSDFYDQKGKIYIISDGTYSYTKIDILTQLHQIAGRIRNSQLNKSIQIITIPSLILDKSDKKAFKKSLKEEYKIHQTYLNAQNKSMKDSKDEKYTEMVMGKLLKDQESNPYYINDNGFVKMNQLYIPSRLYSWDVLHQSYVYKFNDKGEKVLSDNSPTGITLTDNKIVLPPKAVGKAMLGVNYNFKELAIAYLDARKEEAKVDASVRIFDPNWNENSLVIQIGKLVPLLEEAHLLIGGQGIINLNYNKSKIRKAIDKKSPMHNVAKHLILPKGWYSNTDIKSKLQQVYSKASPNLKAKARDIYKYYVAKDQKKTIAGKRINGVEIMKPLRKQKK